MSAECCGAGAQRRLSARRGRRGQRVVSLLAFVPAALLTIALPKCPLCLAAHLAFLGVSGGMAAAMAPLASPLRIALAILALGLLLRAGPVREHRRRATRWLRAGGGKQTPRMDVDFGEGGVDTGLKTDANLRSRLGWPLGIGLQRPGVSRTWRV